MTLQVGHLATLPGVLMRDRPRGERGQSLSAVRVIGLVNKAQGVPPDHPSSVLGFRTDTSVCLSVCPGLFPDE